MDGNGFHAIDPEWSKKVAGKIAEFWNLFDQDDEIDVAIRERLEPLKQKVTEALYFQPPDLIKAMRLTEIARRILHDSGGT